MPDPVRIVLSGATGRMGQTLARLIHEDAALQLVAGIGKMPEPACEVGCPVVETPETAGEWIRAADVVIDFSAPELLRRILEMHGDTLAGKALVVGTTGLGDGERGMMETAARRTAVLQAANFSVGVNLLVALAERAAQVLGDDYDVEIVEAHHRRKVDAPSGTALALGEAVARGRGVALEDVRIDGRSGRPGERPRGQVAFHALRGGDIVGEHRLMLIGERERIELAHLAQDRALFAEGALRAARWIAGKPAGSYTMKDVLGL
ncbi:4-hydroxy-tetrahydrodipicolinate reductase [Longimicrobium sp.]|uniref:4-hydroxy-tetrahydrodipicolinate reductase n=1 Tax=Longimicrobium sp. TaxID=2029185 RepID=UPI002B68091F|nr:4-hydroxy-tetrahydrodipicolinate reductase [Longimicrobium sp.]HSU12643.1 4-hydroxy-tetrahydrodipicolinate reductase [Longimicrobium sp.]